MAATPNKMALHELRKIGNCLFFLKNGQRIPPWHDIPLFADSQETVSMVVEIPRKSHAKMEVGLALVIHILSYVVNQVVVH